MLVGKARYRIGEVAKGLDLGQYTLKHYEHAGLVAPEVDDDSGYRSYGCVDFGKLIIVRNLRRMGFSVEGVAELVADDAAGALARLHAQQVENDGELARLTRANELLSRRTDMLERFLADRGTWRRDRIPAMRFHRHFRDERRIEGLDAEPATDAWRDAYEQGLVTICVPREGYERRDPHAIEWGFVEFREENSAETADPGATRPGIHADSAADGQPVPSARPRGDAGSDGSSPTPYLRVFPACEALVACAELPRTNDMSEVLFPLMDRVLGAANLSLAGDACCLVPHAQANDSAISLSLMACLPVAEEKHPL